MEEIRDNIEKTKKKMEPVVKELLAYSKRLKENPNARPSKALLSAFERGKILGDKAADALKMTEDLLTDDPKDNSRVLFFASLRMSMIASNLIYMFSKSDNMDDTYAVIDAANAIRKYFDEHPKSKKEI